jgi:hypothetical protein
MRHTYLLALALGLAASQPAHAQTTDWRPFRPDFIYSFMAAASLSRVHTLRVDSAYRTPGGDSAYAFNRLLRRVVGVSGALLKTPNNLLGARLRWLPGTADYYLEANAEPTLGGPVAPVALLLRPRVAAGSTWVASTQPALTATLSSRTLGTVGTTPDSVATITLSNGQRLVVSKHYGLVQGPQWLGLATPTSPVPADWYQAVAAQPGLGSFDPRQLFAMQPGALLGYTLESPTVFTAFVCQSGYRLRRILTRQETADSLVIRYQEQDNLTTLVGPAACSSYGPAGPSNTAVRLGRWAFSLRTGASPQFPMLPLLSGEVQVTTASTPLGYYNTEQQFFVPTTTATIAYQYATRSPGTSTYLPGLDLLGFTQTFTTGAGHVNGYTGNLLFQLGFYCPTGAGCAIPAGYANLLPTRAAQAAALASLHPNPAAGAALLTLAAPLRTAATLALTDVLGRPLWQSPLAPGQLAAAIPLASLQAGLYLVQLQAPDVPPATWKIIHQ